MAGRPLALRLRFGTHHASRDRCRPVEQPQAPQHGGLAARLGQIEAAVALAQFRHLVRLYRPGAQPAAEELAPCVDELAGDQDAARRGMRLQTGGDQERQSGARPRVAAPSPAISTNPASPPKRMSAP